MIDYKFRIQNSKWLWSCLQYVLEYKLIHILLTPSF